MRISYLFSIALLGIAHSSPVSNSKLFPQCSVTFEGRIPDSRKAQDFDSSNNSPYTTNAVLSSSQRWSNVITFPNIERSLYDNYVGAKPFQISINDQSIVQPPNGYRLTGVRRAELMPGPLKGDTAYPKTIFTGQQTFHFSLRYEDSKPLNFSHEYQFFFLENTDANANQLLLKAGNFLDGSNGNSNPPLRNLYFLGHSKSNNNILWRTTFAPGWHNFALELDFAKNTVRIYYSRGQDALVPVTGTVNNDLSGYGTVHIGVLKKPTGVSSDPNQYNYNGRQENNINEAVNFGGIFEESGALNCSLGDDNSGRGLGFRRP